MTLTLQALERCRIRIEDNIRVLKGLNNFFKCLPDKLESPTRAALSWKPDAVEAIKSLQDGLVKIIARNEGILARVGVLEKLTGSRADYVSLPIRPCHAIHLRSY